MWTVVLLSTLAAMQPDVRSDRAAFSRRALTNSELAKVVRGSFIGGAQAPGRHYDLNVIEWFYPDGAYRRDADNAEFEGRYRIVNDQVCVTVENKAPETCRDLFVDSGGGFWMVEPGSTNLRGVRIRTIREGANVKLTRQ